MLKLGMQVTPQLMQYFQQTASQEERGTSLLVLSYLQEQGHRDDGKKDV